MPVEQRIPQSQRLSAEQPELELIELPQGLILPAVALPEAGVFVAFADGEIRGVGDVYERWENEDDYLVSVVNGLNSEKGKQFADEAITSKKGLHYFPYVPDQPRYLAPCEVRKTANGKDLAVVIYSFGPK